MIHTLSLQTMKSGYPFLQSFEVLAQRGKKYSPPHPLPNKTRPIPPRPPQFIRTPINLIRNQDSNSSLTLYLSLYSKCSVSLRSALCGRTVDSALSRFISFSASLDQLFHYVSKQTYMYVEQTNFVVQPQMF